MKLLHNVPAVTKAIILAAMMSACQNEKDGVVAPANSLEQPTDANAKTITKLLIKDGGTKLTYSGIRNLLTKELNDAEWLREYSYVDNKIVCALSKGSAKINNYATYTLNAKGLCEQSAITQYSSQTVIYKYNEMNRLSLAYNKATPNLRQEYKYELDADGQGESLRSITFYDKYDVKLKVIEFKYMDGTNGSWSTNDLYPVNPDHLAEATSKYLPMFGKFSRYLVKQKLEKVYYVPNGVPAETEFNYSYNSDAGAAGVKTIKTTDYFGKLLSTVERQYLMPMVQ